MTLLLFVLVSHPLLPFYGFVHYLNKCGLCIMMCYLYTCVMLQLGDITLHMYVVMVT